MKLFKLGKDFYFSFCPKMAGSVAEELGRGKTPYFLAEKTTGRGQIQSISSRLASRAEPTLYHSPTSKWSIRILTLSIDYITD